MAISQVTKRLAFFIPLAASVPLWLGALPDLPIAAGASDGSAGQAKVVDSPYPEQGFAPAVPPDGNEAPAGDKLDARSTIEDMAGPPEATANSLPASATAPTPSPKAGRPAAGADRRKPPAPARPARRSSQSAPKKRMLVTGYCPCRECCGRWSAGRRTACGQSVYSNRSRFVAADTDVLPFGWQVSVPGYHGGVPVPVLDRGSLIVGRRLDVFFLSHAEAKRWGVRSLEVTVYRS
jgi:3D (Asp-Asp-Asp) domain-containing protein